MTRSHKANDRDHAGLAAGTAAPEEHLPRYFAKSGHADVDPKKVKKEGGGRGNWGVPGEEAGDYGYSFVQTRRRSNSSTHTPTIADFKTKFETVEDDPVFEEQLHGARAEDDENELHKSDTADSAESTSGASVEEEADVKHVYATA